VGLAAWAAFENLAAANAEDETVTMQDQRSSLAPLKSDIDQLLKKEESLRQIATGYTNAEAAHVYWMDVLAEVRGAFASDAVWLTDIEPLSGYVATAADARAAGSKASAKEQNGKSLIKAEFAAATYGSSSLVDSKSELAAPGRKSAGAEITANAVRIKGFWRKTEKGQNVVSELLKKLRDQSTHFRFSIKDSKGAEVELRDERILDITVVGEPGILGLPFEITLPLAREAAAK
jgi:hypothetical protein